jgi:polyisoprenoid-binding protein YceI
MMHHRGLTAMYMSCTLVCSVLLAGLPSSAAERYVISQQKSQLRFRAYSLLVRPWGTFHRFSGDIVADAERLKASRVTLVIEAASIDTGNAKRDAHLRSEDFLFVERYPTITFLSTLITKNDAGYMVQGDLHMRGVTKRITLSVTVEQRRQEIVVRGRGWLYRRDFGINYNAFFNPVRNAVDVVFTIVGVKP